MKKFLLLGILTLTTVLLLTSCSFPKEAEVIFYSPFYGKVSSNSDRAGMSDDVIKRTKEWGYSFVVVATSTEDKQWLIFRNISRIYLPYWNPEGWGIQYGHPLLARGNGSQDGRDVWFVSADKNDIQTGDRIEALYYDSEREEYVKVFEAVYLGKTTFINLTHWRE